MKQNWRKLVAGALPLLVSLVVGILYLDDFIGAIERISDALSRTALYDYLRREPESGKARILVADVRHDENGRYTAEIREMLRRGGKQYRVLGRVYGAEDEQGSWDDIEQLLEKHKSVILLEGSVSANGKTIRIRVRNRDGSIDKRAEIVLNGSSSWTEKLSDLIVEATQELVDDVRVERFTIKEYEELAETVRDALTQSKTEEDRLQAQFQLAYLEGDIAFLKQDTEAMLKVLEMYQEPLQKYEGEYQEGPIRINMGATYENVGRITEDRTLLKKAKEEYIRAEEIFEKHENIEKTLKARTARFRLERQEWFEDARTGGKKDVSRLIEMSNAIVRMLSLHPDKITGLQGWLSNEERLYIDLLWAAATKDREKYEKAKHELVGMRDYLWEQISNRGFDKNPWALSLLLCRDELQAEELWAHGQMGKSRRSD